MQHTTRGHTCNTGAHTRTNLVLGEVAVHLVAVKVRVVGVAVGVVHADSLLAWVAQHARVVRHDAWLVQRRLWELGVLCVRVVMER